MESLEVWPTHIGIHHYEMASNVNPLFRKIFHTMRVTDDYNGQNNPFYASRDDLLNRVKLNEWTDFVNFAVAAVRDTAKLANVGVWPEGSVDLQIEIKGIWFQISNGGVHHDIHTHGNCSWSAVYIVDVDEHERRISHPSYGVMNGVTRFYSPLFERLGGAYSDFGNAYLQNATADFDPIPGRLTIFPSWLPHQAMPYQGERDRVIISFNAGVGRIGQSDALSEYASS